MQNISQKGNKCSKTECKICASSLQEQLEFCYMKSGDNNLQANLVIAETSLLYNDS